MTPPVRPHGLHLSLILLALLAAAATACGQPSGDADELVVTWRLEPASPLSNETAQAQLTLHDRSGRPVSGARLRIEGHMNHPGMAPLVAEATERTDGVYDAPVTFTMAGPWTIVADGTLADGRRLTRTFDVPNVR